jgi:rhodanese-related sulfurtransferase
MKRLFIIIICLIFLCSCGVNNNDIPPVSAGNDTDIEDAQTIVYRTISAEEAKEIMLSGVDFILLDVRTDSEYEEKRIDGAVLIPDYEITDRAESELPDKDAVILIYCRSGRRSANSAQMLADMGYTNVYDFGGILNWMYDTISG